MKNKLVLISVFMFLGLLALGTEKVLAQVVNLPRVTIACESKVGLLMGIDDGFSVLKKCPKNSRKVILGEESQIGGQIGAGEIAFLIGSMNHVLKKDGTVWWYDDMGRNWQQDFEKSVTGIVINDITQWNITSLLTKEGDVWVLDNGIWVNMGVPGEI